MPTVQVRYDQYVHLKAIIIRVDLEIDAGTTVTGRMRHTQPRRACFGGRSFFLEASASLPGRMPVVPLLLYGKREFTVPMYLLALILPWNNHESLQAQVRCDVRSSRRAI